MQIAHLEVKNYRGVEFDQDFAELGNVIVLSGKNGTGKTTILEAINILLGKPRNQISQEMAQAITAESCELALTLKLSKDDIDHILASVRAFLSSNQFAQINYDEVKDFIFRNGVFKRKLNIKKYETNWRAESSVQELIFDEDYPWPMGFDNQFFQTLSLFFGRLDDVNAGQVNLLNTQIEFSRIVNTQIEGQRKNKSTVQLQELFSIPLNKEILEAKLDDIEKTISEQADYLSAAIETGKIDFDKNHFRQTGTVLLEFVSGENKFPISQASAGQKQAIALLALMRSWSVSKAKPVLLLDEPDLGMHPYMIRAVTSKFKEELSNTNSTCIIATHSTDLIKSYGDNVFRLLKEEDGKVRISKVEGLNDRIELLKEVGAEFDLDYLVRKMVFVESVEGRNPKYGLADEEIYQRMIDPKKQYVIFKSGINNQGEAARLSERKEAYNSVVRAIIGADPNVWTLRDRDDKAYVLNNDTSNKNTPYKNVEYLFVVSPQVVSESLSSEFSISKAPSEIREYFARNDSRYAVPIEKLNVDGKKLWQGFLDKLRQENFEQEDTARLERDILERLKQCIDILPSEVRDFFQILKS